MSNCLIFNQVSAYYQVKMREFAGTQRKTSARMDHYSRDQREREKIISMKTKWGIIPLTAHRSSHIHWPTCNDGSRFLKK